MNDPGVCPLAKTSAPDTRRWLLAHDIADSRRLKKTWRLLRKTCIPLQYSLYLVHGTRHELDHLLDQLRAIIDQRKDDIRVYPIGVNTRLWGLGTQLNNGDNTLTDDLFLTTPRSGSAIDPASDTMATDLSFDDAPKIGNSPSKPLNPKDFLD